MAYRTRITKAQKAAQHLFFAMNWQKKAREALATEGQFEEYKRYAAWRDRDMVKATGKTWQEYHDWAFPKN
jgi:hypothetical protein